MGAAIRTPLPWSTVTLLAMTAFASSGMMRTLDPMLPRLASEYHVPIGSAAWAITAFAVAYGVLQSFFGPLGDRHGKLRVIAGSAAVAVMTCLGCAVAGASGSFSALIVARALAGASCAAAIPLSMAWIGDAVPYERRQTVLARFMMGQMIGMACGQTVGGFAAGHAWWQWPFVLFAAVFATAAILLWRRNARVPELRAGTQRGHAGQALLDVLRVPWARVVLLAVLLEAVCYLGAFTFIATHLHTVGGLSLSRAGLILIAFSGGGVAYALWAHRWIGRHGEARVVAIGTVLTASSLALLAVVPQPLPATLASFVSGVGFYMLHNTLQLNATQMAPTRRGAAVALFATCFFVGQSIGIALFGLIGDRWGTTSVLLLGAICVLPVGLLFAHKLRMRRVVAA